MRKLTIFIILMLPFLHGKVLHPQGNKVGEMLSIKGELREYHSLYNDLYIVSGPSIISIYSRLAVPKNEKGVHPFSIKSFLLDGPELIHEFKKGIDYSVSSSLHPMHYYTKFSKIEIKIPEGEFMLSVENLSKFGKPILARVIQKTYKK